MSILGIVIVPGVQLLHRLGMYLNCIFVLTFVFGRPSPVPSQVLQQQMQNPLEFDTQYPFIGESMPIQGLRTTGPQYPPYVMGLLGEFQREEYLQPYVDPTLVSRRPS